MTPVPNLGGSSFCAPKHALEGHTGGVLALAATQNGRYLISASQDKTLRLWNPHSGTHIKTFNGPHNYEINDVIVTDDNSKFISCGGDKHFFQWDVTTAQVIRKFVGHDRKVNALAYGPGQDVVMSASHDKSVRVWDLRSRDRGSIQALTDATDSVLCVTVAGDEITTGSTDGGLRRYDVRKGQLVTDQFSQPIGSISYSKDKQCMLVSTLDHNIRLIDMEGGSELCCYKGHANQRFKVQSTLDPSDAYVVSGSEDHRVFLWDIEQSTNIGSLSGHEGPVFCARFFDETLVTASADGSIRVWSVTLPSNVKPAAFPCTAQASLRSASLPTSFGKMSSGRDQPSVSTESRPKKAARVDFQTIATEFQDSDVGCGWNPDRNCASVDEVVKRRKDKRRKDKRKS
eukprot:TRINITY_DN51702_c0_g1_i1.p1 TRINITY_DN51702_c0_g1~~TRINITY_DN51702_c0_g1_i1.p1  ORF type:complete len:411 (-),score=47.07 TRINITY_DN51702_c0_g1_i1:10-1212(-)